MSGLAFSELAMRIVREHRRRGPGSELNVVPVVCTGLTPADPGAEVLAAAIRAEDGGTVINLDDLADGVEGEVDTLRDGVESFADPDDPTRSRLTVAAASGKVQVTFTDGTSPPWSKGNRTLAGAMLGPFSKRLRQSEIVVLSYDENLLDEPAANAVWQFYCLHVPKHDLGRVRTLVVSCLTAELMPARHCQKFKSARFVLTPGKVTRRRDWEGDKQEIRRLGEEATDPVVLFLAAGFSSSSETTTGLLPMGNELRDRALRRLIGDFESETEAAGSFRSFCEGRGSLLAGEENMSPAEFQRALTLERVLHLELAETSDELGPTLSRFLEETEEAKAKPGDCLDSLRALLEGGRRLVLITVNFDELIEEVCGGLVQPFASESGFTDAADAVNAYLAGDDVPAPLLKLHGTLSDPASIIATAGSVAKGLPAEKASALDALLGRDHTRRRLWFYIGASMRDRDILQRIGSREYGERVDEWWVSPTRDGSVEAFIREQRDEVWKDIGLEFGARAKCITVTADVFMGELRSVVL